MRKGRTSKPPVESIIPKAVLAKEIAKTLRARELTQTEAAWLIKDAPSQLSLVVTGKTRGFSAERLLRMLTRLGKDVDVVLRKTKGNGPGRVRVSIT